MVKKILIAAMLLLPLPAQAFSGNDLLKACEDNARKAGCEGYIFGVFRATYVPICPPKETDSAQLRDVVVKFLKANPETRHDDSVALIQQSLSLTFPCPK